MSKPQQATVSHEDPDEVDISEHHYTPRITPRPSNPGTPGQQALNPFGPMPPGFGPPQGDAANDTADPMMRMMQQMMSGAGGAGGFPPMGDPNDPNNAMNDLPPMLKNLLAAQNASQGAQQPMSAKSSSALFWRVIHALFAVALAAYIALTGTFNGTKLSRHESVSSNDYSGPKLFYLFATAELLLQTSRYFVEKGQLQGSGWLATIANSGLVPEPYGGWIRVVGRYSVIWQTVVGDAMVVVFLLGAVAWARGAAVA